MAKSLKYVFPSTGHCGSRYVASLMTDAGIVCGHERVFNGDRLSLHYIDNDMLVAESSAFAPPFLAHPVCDGATIIQIVRHPLNVLRSWLYSEGAWGPRAHPAFVAGLEQHPELWKSKLPLWRQSMAKNPDWLATFYLAWNDLIQKLAPGCRVFRIEDGPKLLDYVETEGTTDFDDRSHNSHSVRKEPLTWDVVRRKEVRERLLERCFQYGYTENPDEAIPKDYQLRRGQRADS